MDDGITYGGGGLANRDALQANMHANFSLDDSAPIDLEATADATYDLHELIGILITMGGAAVHHSTHKVGAVVTCSMQSESYASTRAADLIIYAREIQRAFGISTDLPTFIGTDSLSHSQLSNKLANAGRSKPFLKQYVIQAQRQKSSDITVGHISDLNMPADFLTKWISSRKLRMSIIYATNPSAFVPRLAPVAE